MSSQTIHYTIDDSPIKEYTPSHDYDAFLRKDDIQEIAEEIAEYEFQQNAFTEMCVIELKLLSWCKKPIDLKFWVECTSFYPPCFRVSELG